MPTENPDWISQTTLPSPGSPLPATPQQSESLTQRSPSMWQPSAGWQTLTLYGPYGAQSRLQQSPQPLQTFPSMPPLQKLAPAGGAPHVPSDWPWAMVQTPPQQSGPCVHVSPSWMQNDDAMEHRPPVQSCEQHSEPCDEQALPAVLHAALSALHVPLVQSPPQHSEPAVHGWPSDAHAAAEHDPATHDSEQQSSEVLQAAAVSSQLTGDPPRQVRSLGLH
jgi:hypothetical protein